MNTFKVVEKVIKLEEGSTNSTDSVTVEIPELKEDWSLLLTYKVKYHLGLVVKKLIFN